MNRLMTLFGFLLITTMVLAQGTISITLTGTVADVDGNGIGNIDVNIVVDSIEISDFSYYNVVTTNDDGTYSDTFEVPEAITQGLVFAWIEDCNNGFGWEEGFWSPGGDPTIDFVYCNTNCSVDIIDTTGVILNALVSGEAPFTFLWNTGEISSNIVPETSGTYCVTTTDANGCTANDCFYFEAEGGFDTLCLVTINIDSADTGGLLLTAVASGDAPFSYFWNTQATTQSINITGVGEYCLSVIDATGCVASSCIDFGNGCDENVSISEINGSLVAITNYSGTADFSWSTGALGNSIIPQAPGQYCVTMNYAEGCLTSACYYYQDSTQMDSCYLSIDVVQGGAWLQVSAGGVAPFIYEWSNGSTSNSIEITEDTLCVTITDAVGCVASACYATVEMPLIIEGYISTNSQDSIFLDAVVVDLFSIDEGGVSFVTSVESNGYYRFNDVATGNYIVRAVADGYLPSYHLNSEWWDEATVIAPSSNNNQWYEIQLIDIDGLVAGPGGITGTVSEPDGFGGHDDDNRSFEPIEGAEIILFDSENAPVAYVFTNADGGYAFPDLPYGTYTVYIEIVGYEQAFYTVTLGPDNEIANNINFIVDIDNTMIATATKEALLDENLLSVFPNPVKGVLKINLNTELRANANIEVRNITGQIVFSDTFSQYEQQKSIDVSGLNTGLYLLKVTTGKGIIIQQFVKQ